MNLKQSLFQSSMLMVFIVLYLYGTTVHGENEQNVTDVRPIRTTYPGK